MTISLLRSLVVNGGNKNALLLASMPTTVRQLMITRTLRTINDISNGNLVILASSQPKCVLIIAKRYEKFGFERMPYRQPKPGGLLARVLTDSPLEKAFRYFLLVMLIYFVFFCDSTNPYHQQYWPPLKPGETRDAPKDSNINVGDYFKGFWKDFFTWIEVDEKNAKRKQL